MSTMTPEAFAVWCRSPVEYELGRATRAGMTEAAHTAKWLAQASIWSVAPNGLKTRKGGARGKVSAFYQVYGYVDAFAVIAVRGPLALIENDTPPHVIQMRNGTKQRSRAKKKAAYRAVAVGPFLSLEQFSVRRGGLFVTGSYVSGGLALFARHPGTRGQRPFAKSADAIERAVPGIIERSLGPVGD